MERKISEGDIMEFLGNRWVVEEPLDELAEEITTMIEVKSLLSDWKRIAVVSTTPENGQYPACERRGGEWLEEGLARRVS